MLAISQLIGVFCFIRYGRLLVSLLNDTVRLRGANDHKNNPTMLAKLSRYNTYLRKVNIR
jgi:hypothetical protein